MLTQFLEVANIVSAFVPVDLKTGANTGDWVSLEQHDRVVVVLFKGAGTAGEDPVFKLQQAKDNAGAQAKDLTFTTVYSKVGAQTGIAAFTKTTQAAATSYTDATSAEAEAIIAVEVRARDLDAANGFTHLQLSIAGVGAAAQIGCGLYLMLDPKYVGGDLPSPIS